MMTMGQTKTAVGVNLTASFLASGGVGPVTYAVLPGGAGGSIDPNTGLYTAPPKVSPDPRTFFDKIVATDSSVPPQTVQASILVAYPWMLVLDIIQKVMNLDPNKVYFWNVKQFLPTDDTMAIMVTIPRSKPLGSGQYPAGPVDPQNPLAGPGWDVVENWTYVSANVDIHIYSRGLDAINRLPELFMALQSSYARQQQESNGFYLSKIPTNAVDLSGLDGDAIPYHFVVSVVMMYSMTQVVTPDFYDQYGPPEIIYNS